MTPSTPKNSFGTSNGSSVPMDGLGAPDPIAQDVVAPTPDEEIGKRPEVKRAKGAILFFGTVLYLAYVGWCALLLMVLPSPTGDLSFLIPIGLMSIAGGALLFLLIGFIALQRIAKSKASIALKRRSLLRALLVLAPALALSAITAFLIVQEPALQIDITKPTKAEDFVAPVPVTLSVERAVEILRKQGRKATKFQWDTDGDGKANDETVTPTTTVLYEQAGAYSTVVRITLDDGSFRRLTRRITLPQAVFTITPTEPVVEKPVSFDVSHLLTDPKQLSEVTWDFGDGTDTEKTKGGEVVHTYFAIGEYKVTAVLLLANKTQTTYKKTILVVTPPPLPFPITLLTEPPELTGPSPLSALFHLETDEPIREVEWDFGDGKDERGAQLLRVGHTFDREGVFSVTAHVRSASGGELAELSTIVRVTPSLTLSDLVFDGEPRVQSDKMQGEAPLRVKLTPRTSVQLVQFRWETTDAITPVITGNTFEAVYRKPGTYTLTLIGEDAEGKVMRRPLTIDVTSPAPEPTILMKPESGEAPLAVVFDASQSFVPDGEQIAGFKWTFGDEVGGNRQEQPGSARVEHTYASPGEFIVTLRIVMASGKEYSVQRTIVVRRPSLSACFTSSRLSVQAGKGIEFDSSCSTGEMTSYLWDVRKDDKPDTVVAQSTLPSYVHVFDAPGTYTVSLTLKDKYGAQDTTSVSVSVTTP